jgi:ABC-type branched-subunit amino acid transport system substrate-binding protein
VNDFMNRALHRRGAGLRNVLATAAAAVLAVGACGASRTPTPVPSSADAIHVGAVFPTAGNAAGLAGQELAGVQAAANFINADGGVHGRRIVLDVRDLEAGSAAPSVMADLKAAGVSVVIGAYSSELSIPASQAANDTGLVYWEAGAVADQLTGRGLPLVFRVGASGANLGMNSADFAAAELVPRLGKTAAATRVAIVNADDAYATSVADAARAAAAASGLDVVAGIVYDLNLPNWPDVMRQLQAAGPDVIILASHIPDGVAFRRAMLAANLRVGALIGSTMAECDPDFAGDLGPDAIGIFASDRPTGGFQPAALNPTARALYDRLAAAWPASTAVPTATGAGGGSGGSGRYGYDYGTPAPGSSGSSYTITGPVEEGTSGAGPTEEGLSGFSAAWVLFHDVLPAADPGLAARSIAAAARAVDLPTGSLPNGAGVRFSSAAATLGQNERAAAVIWQWQAERSYTFVWPPTYQTGDIAFVPLNR